MNIKQKVVAVVGAASAFPFIASAQTGVDTTEILAAIADSETKGLAIATAVTVMLFLFAGVKYLRRAK